ncbi:MAG: PSD1 domain-containing protein [Planctomycetales bacterium]|nr:PSD1 domain-containing protein [Planctomycetales bacterium]
MNRQLFLLLLFFPTAFALADEIDFNRDIRPILSDKCFHCHGPDANDREADLRFDTEEGAMIDLGGYRAIEPHDPEASEMLNRITTDDEDLRMPPVETNKAVSPEETELLRQWIAAGAPWSGHWAFQKPTMHSAPQVSDKDWSHTMIDRFLFASAQRHHLTMSPPADPTTLVRRLYFDLVGLPPTPEVVSSFAKQPSPDAYAALVDSLLESPHFGERMAVYWLDLVRYADTVGYHGDQDHNISPYRDYVIDAFNSDLPFNQFTREQLAGDLLPDATMDQKIASGYNRLLQTTHEGGLQPQEYRTIYAADRVRNVSAVWLGGTLGCAQCHDHKFDPYTLKDFYSMAAFFADIDDESHFKTGTNNLPTKRPPEIDVLNRQPRMQLGQLEAQAAELQQQLETCDANVTPQLQKNLHSLQHEIESLQKQARTTMITVALDQPRVTRVLPRGNWLDESGEIVEPAVPEFLGSLDLDRRANRLDLAQWLVDPDAAGLLTSRVFVNRIWYLLFNEGLARSLDDFGGQGVPPDHPELLDNLAVEFVGDGWSVKRLIRRIVMSHAYRQSSAASPEQTEVDPLNRYFARQNRFRLPAEFVRDTSLAVSGLLVDDVGGASVRPYQPAGYYRHLNFPPRKYAADQNSQQWRRGVYVHWQRQFLHPMLKSMDAPSREECTARRSQSNTPLAALTLLNDPSFVEAARAFAERTLRQARLESDEAKIGWAFAQATSRTPDAFETNALLELLQVRRQEFQTNGPAADQLLQVGSAPLDGETPPVELAAWTSVCRAILNLHEVINRN